MKGILSEQKKERKSFPLYVCDLGGSLLGWESRNIMSQKKKFLRNTHMAECVFLMQGEPRDRYTPEWDMGGGGRAPS